MHHYSQNSQLPLSPLGKDAPEFCSKDQKNLGSANMFDRLQLHWLLLHLSQPLIPTSVTTERCPGYQCLGIETYFLKTQVSLGKKKTQQDKTKQADATKKRLSFLDGSPAPDFFLASLWAGPGHVHTGSEGQVNYHSNSFQFGKNRGNRRSWSQPSRNSLVLLTVCLLPLPITLSWSYDFTLHWSSVSLSWMLGM